MAGLGSNQDAEIIFESWLYKLRGNIDSQFLRLSGVWNKKYFILVRISHVPVLYYFTKKPKSATDEPQCKLELKGYYRVEKKPAFKGKDFVCQLTTPTKVVCLASHEEHIHTLFMFFLNAQRKLKESLEPECFIVRPENSDEHRRVGSRGALCLLHVSIWGVTLALQLSKCILAQWPLRCIRTYECNNRGRFGLETGSHASTGRGNFVFSTRPGHDVVLYERIDAFIDETASLEGMVLARQSNDSSLASLDNDYQGLASLTHIFSDNSSIVQLKRISRDIYDHLAEHLGSSSAVPHGSSPRQNTGSVSALTSFADVTSSSTHREATPTVTSLNGKDRNLDLAWSSQYLITVGLGDRPTASSPQTSSSNTSFSSSTLVDEEPNPTYSFELRTTSSLVVNPIAEPVDDDHRQAISSSDVLNTTSHAAADVPGLTKDIVVDRNPAVLSKHLGHSRTSDGVSEYVGMSLNEASVSRSPPASYINTAASAPRQNSTDLYSYA